MSKKICIVTTSLGKGGAERTSAILSQLLSNLGYKVNIVITKNIVSYNYLGELFSLERELKDRKSTFSKFKLLKKYFAKNKFDYVIDNRPRSRFLKEFILYKFVFSGKNIISVVHSFNFKNYMFNSKWLTRLLYGNIYKIIAVSDSIKDKIESVYNLKNVTRIYNNIDNSYVNKKSKDNVSFFGEFILYYGRIEEKVKNLSLLINGYNSSQLPKSKVKLLIIGEGPDLSRVKRLVVDLGLNEDVNFLPFIANPFPYVSSALYTVLTSRYEGFPMVLIESLMCKTPVISVNCNSGPSEIIVNKKNGLLIDNHNIEALANAMNLFIEDKELYAYCKNNTSASVSHLEIDKIALEWKKIIDGGV